jgi:cell division protein FtsB
MTQGASRIARLVQQNRSLIAIMFVLVVVAYFLVAFADQAWRARELQADAAQQRAAIAVLERDNGALRRQVDTYASAAYDDYVQSRARRDLNLANDGETLLLIRWGVRDEAPAGTQAADPAAEPVPNWRRWLDVLSGE